MSCQFLLIDQQSLGSTLNFVTLYDVVDKETDVTFFCLAVLVSSFNYCQIDKYLTKQVKNILVY